MQRKKIVLSITLALGLAQSPAHAEFEPVIQLGDLNGTTGFRLDGLGGDSSGFSVSTAGDINGDGFDDLIIGARLADPNGTNSGSSYVVFGSNVPFTDSLNLSTLDGNNGFRLDGELLQDQSGTVVSTAGDINGDGFDDLIIGASGARPNGNSSGSSYVVFGNNTPFTPTLNLSALDGTNGFRLDGSAFDYSGRAVSNAGDVNGDGFDDLIIGAAGALPGGNSYVIFGSNTPFSATLNLSTLDGSNGFRLDGATDDQSGTAVSTAGDINGDGFDDILIGAFAASPNGFLSGSSYVIFGTNTPFNPTLNLSTLDGTNGFRLDGEAPNHYSGYAVSTAGDVNGDGFDDILIGARNASPNGNRSGSSYLVFGNNTPFTPTLNLSTLDGSNGFRLDGAATNDRSGFSISTAGDVNGDGFDDLIIGAYGADTNGDRSGSSYLVFGSNTPFNPTVNLSALDGINGFRLDGSMAFDFSGVSVSNAGDVNGDGFDDLIIGANGATPGGSSYVVFGRVPGVPLVDFDVNLIDFGDTLVGTSSDVSTVTLSNPGTGQVRIDTINLTDPAFVITGGDCGTLPIRIGINETCTLDLQFTPQAVGTAVTKTIFESNSATNPDSFTLIGNGTPPPIVSLQPDPLVFIDTQIGNSITETLTVENTGPSTLEPGMVSIIGTDAADFSIAMNNCMGAQLELNQSCEIDVSFTPSAPGTREAMLQLESNAPSSPDFVELIGSSDVIFKSGFE